MVTDSNDLQRLNALIDGELPPAEHAALAARIAAGRDLARAHATLARLKACVVEGGAIEAAPPIPQPRRTVWDAAAGFAALAAAIALLVAGNWLFTPHPDPGMHAADRQAVIIRAALPVEPAIPDLKSGGLELIGLAIERSVDTAVLVASYRGPRGCRLELRVHPASAPIPPTHGTARLAWTSGEIAYELTAFGMPAIRFALISQAAKASTLAGHAPEVVEGRLREARVGVPPCIG
jgi:anti-sigma factor RsiW